MRVLVLFILLAVGTAQEVTFMAYNLKNYLESEVRSESAEGQTRYKPEHEIEALVEIITKAAPDILGLCEIGEKKDLAHLHTQLQAKGLSYQYVEHVDAADPVRHLAILSQYPIVNADSKTKLSYQIGAHRLPLQRGILQVELKIGETSLYALGVHLKSKRSVDYADQALMRLKEAQLVRAELDTLLSQKPDAKVLLYGDLNDTYQSPTLHMLKGKYNTPRYLKPLDLKDEKGEYWTHFWGYERLYSTFDYALCSKALLPHVTENECLILSSPQVLVASDHRPFLVKLAF